MPPHFHHSRKQLPPCCSSHVRSFSPRCTLKTVMFVNTHLRFKMESPPSQGTILTCLLHVRFGKTKTVAVLHCLSWGRRCAKEHGPRVEFRSSAMLPTEASLSQTLEKECTHARVYRVRLCDSGFVLEQGLRNILCKESVNISGFSQGLSCNYSTLLFQDKRQPHTICE